MSADTTSIFYKIGQATKTNINDAIATLKAASNTFSGPLNTFSNNVEIGGNLTVNGTTTTISTTNLDVKDNFINLSKGASDSTFTKDQGFYFERGLGINPGALIFDESAEKFRIGTVAPITQADIGSEKVTFLGKTAKVKITLSAGSSTDTSVSGARVSNGGVDEITFTYGTQATVSDLISNSDVTDYVAVSTNGAGSSNLTGNTFTTTLSPVDATSDNVDVNGGSLDLEKVFLSGVNLGDLADFNAGYSA